MDMRQTNIYAALRGVIDPELGADIVELGMVRDVRVENDGHVDVWIALTVASCPLRSQIENDVRSKILGVAGIESVDTHVGAMTSSEKADLMNRARRNARENATPTQVAATTRVIAVSSGKGGVGKSTTTANLALSLRNRGFEVGVLDADVWGFSIHRMLGVDSQLGGADGLIDPVVTHGMRVVTMGSLVDNDEQALMWRGLVLTRAVEQFLNDVRWGDLDYLVIDMPPGTGDIAMGLARMLPQAEMLLVTTPQLVAQTVAGRAADMARRSHMKIAGIVENMSWFECDHGDHHEIFGSGGGAALAAKLGVPLLARVPLDPESVIAGDSGTPIVLSSPDSPAAHAYATLAQRISTDVLPPIEMAGCTARLKDIFALVESEGKSS